MLFKKVIFAIPFLLLFYLFYFKLNPVFGDIYIIFNLDLQILIDLLVLVALLALASFFFVIFSALANDWRIILPTATVGAAAPLILSAQPLSFLMAGGTFASFLLIYFSLSNKLTTYIDFKPTTLLNPSIKTLITLLILIISITFYLKANMEIKQKGFEIPDSLIDAALKIVQPQTQVKGVQTAQVTLTPEQIELLKQNPDLIRQQGIDPSLLDSLSPQDSGENQDLSGTLKPLLKEQVQKIIEPYLNYIPAILALLFFFTLQFFSSIILLPMPLFISGIFWILEKTSFIKFEKESREVKKLVV